MGAELRQLITALVKEVTLFSKKLMKVHKVSVVRVDIGRLRLKSPSIEDSPLGQIRSLTTNEIILVDRTQDLGCRLGAHAVVGALTRTSELRIVV
ncbi:hypothetical protein DHEL01_v207027 [Diaporthe helianthi]|uniref:Uncharacterized protein n=1 Tax=Diaporthe helianthi TaxID=158607 RepID=A0A2P5HWH1_DIAHE|nr:hypothetical protein DHEL01_v207027 [Diaporthe helianthi]